MTSNDPAPAGEPRPPSHGNISEHHWSRARRDSNREALDYYRDRSKAPGVAEGGGARNFYCMKCDGVIPHDFGGERCPHCAEPIDAHVKRYFNWVEMNEPPESDFLSLLVPLGLIGLIALAGLGWLAWYMWS